ncbi:MAG: DUF4835 family protein [bacterium]|nr:DUF4835 family protein [bacterium]
MKVFSVITAIVLSLGVSQAQELNCQVSIITDVNLDVTTVESDIFEQLEQTVFELMNNTAWTQDKFEVEERINCNLQIQIREIPQAGTFRGFIQVQSSRPAFNSNYNTTIFNFQDDDVTFAFSRDNTTNLVYRPNQFTDNLSSILAFYAYFIIGMDYDSFALNGGTPYFVKAQQVVMDAQNSGAEGWRSNEQGKQNRFWLVDNILQELFSPLRQCNYEYHRKGIDNLHEDREAARKAVYTAMNKLVKVVATRPNSVNLINFVQAKSNELKNMFEDAEMKEKNEIVGLLKRIDPANSSKYQEILN